MLFWLRRLLPRPCFVSNAVSQPIRLALETLVLVLRNSLLCIAVGWLFGYCFTVGNLFSGLPPGEQSYADFSAANIAWFYGVFSLCMVVLMATKLLPEQFVVGKVVTAGTTPRRLNIFQCTMKLLGRIIPHLVLSSIIVVGGDFVMYSMVSESWHRFKPCVYIATFWGFYVMAIADVFVRQIYQTETVRGLVALQVQASKLNPREPSCYMNLSRHQPRYRQIWMPSLRRFSKVYARNLPVMFFAIISIVYVHVMSQFVALQGQWEILGFASTSIALKLALQEFAKALMIAARKPVSRRAMVTLVATPTILVDTQVRMLLLRQSSTNVSVVGSVLLAGFEIVVRAVKSFVVQRKTRGPPIPVDISRRWSSFVNAPFRLASTSQIKPLQVLPVSRTASSKLVRNGTAVRLSRSETARQSKAQREAEQRRLKHRILHAAEIYSDMYAEYIAIGCSYAILFFYRDHPQFQFRLLPGSSLLSKTSDSIEATNTQQNRQLGQLGALQMGTEIIVDFLACVLEAAEGVEFKSFDQNDSFLVYFLAVLAFSNVAISAGLYMR
ncbi:hypothetical protein PC128_g575 [Phytophthora cactorum]|nr:hypothetical protein PC120_g3954 [Phytophthora cactorum]KAG3081938.1 hypothetical protein PC121_g6298 [Phytophthora cactorum]KAG3206630.1 hypothetical protein PC128_g575 [Phytophthora cactorum]KAG4061026.1 hypothetical protein PC123_g4084 [Phytophthora cactorum]